MTRLEFHKDIHVAFRPEIVSKDRTEKRQSPDMMSAAELGNDFAGNGYPWTHVTPVTEFVQARP